MGQFTKYCLSFFIAVSCFIVPASLSAENQPVSEKDDAQLVADRGDRGRRNWRGGGRYWDGRRRDYGYRGYYNRYYPGYYGGYYGGYGYYPYGNSYYTPYYYQGYYYPYYYNNAGNPGLTFYFGY